MVNQGKIRLLALIASPDGKEIVREEIEGTLESPEFLGKELARRILDRGGKRILSRLVS
jgi:hydroxymethylbilane synthase